MRINVKNGQPSKQLQPSHVDRNTNKFLAIRVKRVLSVRRHYQEEDMTSKSQLDKRKKQKIEKTCGQNR